MLLQPLDILVTTVLAALVGVMNRPGSLGQILELNASRYPDTYIYASFPAVAAVADLRLWRI
jgi:hypothetical protein